MMMDSFLCALVDDADNEHIFYIGQVNSEFTKKLTYFVKIAFNKDGSIAESNCECIAGKGTRAACKHVAVLCYALLRFQQNNSWPLRKTCTEQQQTWHMPKKSGIKVSAKKADDIQLDVHVFGVEKKLRKNPRYDPRPPRFQNSPSFNDTLRNQLINFSSSRSRTLSLHGIFEPASIIGLVNDHDYFKLSPLHTLVHNRIKVTKEDAEIIEKNTRQQSRSDAWHKERSWHITASNVGTIVHMTERRDKEKFAEGLVLPKTFHSKAIEWGRSHEKYGLSAYEKAKGVNVNGCGLFISPQYPFLAATPDGIVGETVIEVKCPYSIRDKAITADLLDYLELVDGELSLKRQSNYYHQVQTQMFVSERQRCDFVIWTTLDCQILPVLRNDKIINQEIIPKTEKFFNDYMVPALGKHYFPL